MTDTLATGAVGTSPAGQYPTPAYEHCLRLAAGHYENFPTASRLLLGRARAPAVAAIYAFTRGADDIADEAGQGTAAERLAKLDEWEDRLDRALAGEAAGPIFEAVAHAIGQYGLPPELLRDLLSAFRQDVRKSRYGTVEEMLDYCKRSANPVGRLVLRLHGCDSSQLDAWSDAICTSLQLINFWQDVAVDLEKDRIYLPQSELARYGVRERQLRAGRVDPGYRAVIHQECNRARALLAEGRPLLDAVGGRLQLWLRCVWLGGSRILGKIEAVGFDVFTRRPTLSRWDQVTILARALAGWRPWRRSLPAPRGEAADRESAA